MMPISIAAASPFRWGFKAEYGHGDGSRNALFFGMHVKRIDVSYFAPGNMDPLFGSIAHWGLW